jgi:hypothetical protein
MSAIKFKRSAVPGKVPTPADLDFGEVAINYADGLIYYKKANGTIGTIGGGGGGGGGTVARLTIESTASAGQTVFGFPAGYTVGYVDVSLNGIQLYNDDYTATDNFTIVLAEAAAAGDILRFTSYEPVTIQDVYTQSQADFLMEQAATDKAIVMAIALG